MNSSRAFDGALGDALRRRRRWSRHLNIMRSPHCPADSFFEFPYGCATRQPAAIFKSEINQERARRTAARVCVFRCIYLSLFLPAKMHHSARFCFPLIAINMRALSALLFVSNGPNKCRQKVIYARDGGTDKVLLLFGFGIVLYRYLLPV